jgi:hypothetical protein
VWSFGIFFPFWYVWTKENLAAMLRNRIIVRIFFFDENAALRRMGTIGFEENWGRCYDHNFRRLPIKNGVFLKTNVVILILQKITVVFVRLSIKWRFS